MVTLHIEHEISDFGVWQRAFASFAGHRRQAGVRAERVGRPVDDERYVMIGLDFDTSAEAGRFLDFLNSHGRIAAVRSPFPWTMVLVRTA